jgi:hypothetical protein
MPQEQSKNCRWNNCDAASHNLSTIGIFFRSYPRITRAAAQNFLKFRIKSRKDGNRSRNSGTDNAGESAWSEVSLGIIGCFDLRCHIPGADGREVAFYEASHDQTAGARIVRAGGDAEFPQYIFSVPRMCCRRRGVSAEKFLVGGEAERAHYYDSQIDY